MQTYDGYAIIDVKQEGNSLLNTVATCHGLGHVMIAAKRGQHWPILFLTQLQTLQELRLLQQVISWSGYVMIGAKRGQPLVWLQK